MTINTVDDFQQATSASGEVCQALQIYADVLKKWQAKINLVGPNTIPELWARHMLDSAQLAPFIPPRSRVVDLGSGAGFPGLVLAIMQKNQGIDVHLVESDQRKCAFMREANRLTEAGATIHNERIESLAPLKADVITSRALARIEKLITLGDIHRLSTGKYLFLKGQRWREELTEARKHWMIELKDHPSRTDAAGRILEILETESL